jgi:hypothetical protein
VNDEEQSDMSTRLRSSFLGITGKLRQAGSSLLRRIETLIRQPRRGDPADPRSEVLAV